MEEEIIKILAIGGTPGSIIVAGYVFFRWAGGRFDRIEKALDCKVSKEMCEVKSTDTEHRLNRLEILANGTLEK